MTTSPVRTPFSRVWTIEGRAGPSNVPAYQGTVRAQGPSWSFGDRTPVREPDPERYGGFRIVTAIKGERALPTMSLEARYGFTVSEFLRIARQGCEFDAQVHFGECEDPQDYNRGWQKVLVLEGADISQWQTGDMGTFEQGGDAVVNQTINVNGLDMYEIARLSFAELGAAELVQEAVAIVICDSVTCGTCGIASNGVDRFFAVTLSAGGSPGLPAEVIFSDDGGATISETTIDTLAATEDPSDAACVGVNLAVISNASDSLHYAPIADIVSGTETWTENTEGIIAAGSPNAMFSMGSAKTWVVGDGGYVYFYDDITATPDVQDAGIATTEDLGDVHAFNANNVIAVGANNALIRTQNGGTTWASVTGPNAGTVLNTCWMRGKEEWFIGDAGGQLWYTRDAGVSWTEKTFAGSGSGSVHDLIFPTPTVGFMAHSTGTPAGRILRTIDGGRSWYVLPEGTGSIQANDYIGALAASGEDPNVVYGAGLADDATDGIIVKAA